MATFATDINRNKCPTSFPARECGEYVTQHLVSSRFRQKEIAAVKKRFPIYQLISMVPGVWNHVFDASSNAAKPRSQPQQRDDRSRDYATDSPGDGIGKDLHFFQLDVSSQGSLADTADKFRPHLNLKQRGNEHRRFDGRAAGVFHVFSEVTATYTVGAQLSIDGPKFRSLQRHLNQKHPIFTTTAIVDRIRQLIRGPDAAPEEWRMYGNTNPRMPALEELPERTLLNRFEAVA